DRGAQSDLPEARRGAERVAARRRALITVADQLASRVAEEKLDDLAERESLPVRDDAAVLEPAHLRVHAKRLAGDGADLLGHSCRRLLNRVAQQRRRAAGVRALIERVTPVSGAVTLTRAGSSASSAAAIWPSTLSTPWPISAELASTVALPS